jgi:cystathionine gamma-synthase
VSRRFATRAVQAGLDPDPAYGDVVPAIHQASTYVQPNPGESVGDYDYSRSANPTRTALENALGELEGGKAAAFASGMAAEHALITAVAAAGDHIVLPNDLYGGTYRLVDKVLNRWGLEYTMVDQTDLDELARAVTDRTKLIWVETPTNPTLNVVDIEQVIARRRNALVAVDNTFATPVYQRPLELGADAVIHSTTKYIGGHSDVIGGATVVKETALHDAIKFVQNSIGAVPGPLDAFLVHRGIRTLHVRMQAHTENARAVSEWLQTIDQVADVRWPGFSGMVSFRHPDATAIAARTTVFSLAESLGGVESLIEVPQAMTHQSVEGSGAAVPSDLIRLSCGIEAAEDLVEDLAQAIGAPVPATV